LYVPLSTGGDRERKDTDGLSVVLGFTILRVKPKIAGRNR
jgi:hypothetical protein